MIESSVFGIVVCVCTSEEREREGTNERRHFRILWSHRTRYGTAAVNDGNSF
jgi:hypothetical protein